MKYQNEIENSIARNLISPEDIFDYSETPQQELFDEFYSFCRENLDINSEKLNISPNVFVFTNHFASNAMAIRSIENGYGIFINLGLIKHCSEALLNNEQLNVYVEDQFKEIREYHDLKLSQLGFQIATQFSYYHELAHLIQFSKKNGESSLQERHEDCLEYSEIKHILEINADSYASISLATHIQQYIEKSFGNDVKKEFAENTILALGVCLLNYMSSFYHDLENVYFKSLCHPHPVIRIFNVILNLCHYLNQSPYFEEKNIVIDTKSTTRGVFDFYIELEQNGIFITNFNAALENSVDLKEEIIQYLSELIEFNTDEYFNAMEKWNEQHIT